MRQYLPYLFILAALVPMAQGQDIPGIISGKVVLDATGEPMHGARVSLSPLGRTADTAEDGTYQFKDLPPGTYDIIALNPGLSDEHQSIRVMPGTMATADFRLRVSAVRETVTVTSTGREESTLTMIQSVATLDQIQLTQKSAASIGDVLDGEAGVSKRSSGPGTSRPVIRGFDGDRVLVLEDGLPTGSLSSQSGDHGEPIDVNKLERVEIVRGPSTLLYGSNAIGGVVNAISRHDVLHQHTHDGVRAYVTGQGGSANAMGGVSGGFELGLKSWEFWGSGNGQRTGSYHTPLGQVLNSQTRMSQSDAGLGRYGEKGFFSFNYGFTDADYGVPYNPAQEDPEIASLTMRRNTYRLTFGRKNLGFIDDVQSRWNYSRYFHQELVGGEPETTFHNNQFSQRTVFNQKQRGKLGGSFGLWTMRRDYETIGAEAIAPPTTQNAFAVFGVESLDFDGLRIQFGGRLETNHYRATGLPSRRFTGFSGSFGISKRIGANGAFVANYSHSYRAPALEELYNNGPHPGNQTFEIGNPNLVRERNDGIDLSIRHHSGKARAEANFFYYDIHDFVYLAPTGGIEDGLVEADYAQANSRFTGAEAKLDYGLHQNLWLNLSVDGVSAQLKSTGTPLPRIPPVRAHVGFDARIQNLSVKPEVVIAASQNRIFLTETPTSGYVVANVTGTYTIARTHHLHVLSASLFNMNNELYRNHLSFLKNFAPEIGRGVRFSYTLQIF